MNMKREKMMQILHGILTGIVLWIIGHLLSGRLSFVEDIELYPTGPLVFVFPFIVAATCILIAKYSAKYRKGIYYVTSLICLFLPAICWIISLLLEYIMELRIPVVSFVADIILLIFILPCIAMLSMIYQVVYITGADGNGIMLMIIPVVYFLPMIAGMLISIKIYKNKVKQQLSC